METTIGVKLRDNHTKTWLAFIVAALLLNCDFILLQRWTPGYHWYRYLIAGSGIIFMLGLCNWDLHSLGFVLRPKQGYIYWIKAGLVIGVSILLFSLLVFGMSQVIGQPIQIPKTQPNIAKTFIFTLCVQAPLVEEILYRMVLCIPFVSLAGNWFTILVSGFIFAILHFIYGNPAPDNFIAGFFLSWAYLKSGSLIIPIIFHSIGNAFTIIALIGLSYWIN